MVLAGRRKIFTDESEVTIDNVQMIVNASMLEHQQNVSEIKYLRNYVKGIHPAIRDREKDVRPEINIKSVFNKASQIVEFKLAYEFGSPVTFVQRSNDDDNSGEHDDKAVGKLNEILNNAKKPSVDLKIARDMKVCGLGYRLIEPSKKRNQIIKMTNLDPETTFVIYRNDAYREPLLGVTYFQNQDGTLRISAYSEHERFEFLTPQFNLDSMLDTGITRYPNLIGEIPIIEYVNDHDRMSSFERVISLIDDLDLVNSDRLNDIAQHVQSLLWLNNADIEEENLPNLREYGIIKTKSANGINANVSYVESSLGQSEVQTLVDYIDGQIDIIANIPGRQETGGGSTGAAMNLSNGWQIAEVSAKASEIIFSEGEQRMLSVIDGILANSINVPSELSDLNIMDIDPKFSRNKTYDLATKCSSLAALLNVGVDGLTAFTVVGLFTDPQLAWNNSKDIVDKIRTSKGDISKDDAISIVQNTTQQPSKVSNVDEGV